MGGRQAPLRWLAAAAEQHPQLRLGLNYALPHQPAAFEVCYTRAKCVYKQQVIYHTWVWNHRVRKSELFSELKNLLRFPDGRMPKKRKMKVEDVEARLHAKHEYTTALTLLAHCMWDAGVAAEKATRYRLGKTFHTLALPEFVAWLRLDLQQ